MHCGEVCHTGALEGRGRKKQGGLWPNRAVAAAKKLDEDDACGRALLAWCVWGQR